MRSYEIHKTPRSTAGAEVMKIREGEDPGILLVGSYNPDNGQRLTDCCAGASTYFDDELVCKKCYNIVPFGQGDGSETIWDR